MFMPKRFKFLKEGEIAGPDTINPIIELLRGIRSDSEFIDVNPNGLNGMTISFNEGALFNWLQKGTDKLRFSFQGEISQGANAKIKVSAGTVYVQDSAISISSMGSTTAHNNYVVYAQVTQNSGSLTYTSSQGGGMVQPSGSGHGNRLMLPILQTIKDSSGWYIKYLHIGDFHFVNQPYFWIPGYDKTKKQSLDHDENTDGYVWTEYGECEEEE